MAKTYTAKDLITALRVKFGDSQRYALFEEVANGTGYGASSWIDAILVRLWPSDGLLRSAFEIKVNRQNFLKELQNPTKNEWARRVCHEFWFVAPRDVIKEQELPEGAGWMRPHGDKLAIVRHAQRTKAQMGDEFVAAIARAAKKQQKREEDEIRRNALDGSQEHQEAKRIVGELEAFIASSGYKYYDMRRAGKVKKVLSEIALGAKTRAELRQIRNVLSHFQHHLLDLFDDFLVLTHVSMVECDDLGKFLVETFGERDGVLTLAESRAILEKPKRDRSSCDERNAKRIMGAFDRMRRLRERLDAEP